MPPFGGGGGPPAVGAGGLTLPVVGREVLPGFGFGALRATGCCWTETGWIVVMTGDDIADSTLHSPVNSTAPDNNLNVLPLIAILSCPEGHFNL